jgi:predicted MFS family arabinose efflux permease
MPALLASRFLVGLGEGVAPAAATGTLAKGVPPSQRSKAVTTAFGGLDVGSLSGLLIAPPIIFHLGGWAAVFYLFGALGFFWGAWWFSVLHARFLHGHEGSREPPSRRRVSPSRGAAFVRNPQFWALTVAHFHVELLFLRLARVVAVLLGERDGRDFVQVVFPLHSSLLVHRHRDRRSSPHSRVNSKRRRSSRARKFARVRKRSAFGVGAVTLTMIGLIVNATPVNAVTNQTIAMVVGLLSVTFGFAAFIRTGLFCGHQDLSPKYASIMLGVTNTAAAIASTLSTFFTGLFLSMTGGNWAYSLFFPIAALQLVSVFIFLIWKSDPVDFDA